MRCFILFKLSFFLSNLFTPIKLKESQTRFDLMAISSGESQAREGLRLTSSSHGFKSESTKMSKPMISKQFVL